MLRNIVVVLCLIMMMAMMGCSLSDQSVKESTVENTDGSTEVNTVGSAEVNTEGSTMETGKEQYPKTVNVYTYNGKETTQTIGKAVEKVVIVGSTLAELMVKFGQQDKVVGFAYSDQSDSKYADEINKLPLILWNYPIKIILNYLLKRL